MVWLALGAAFAYAVAMVVQQRRARRVDPAASMRPQLIGRLACDGWWLTGIAVNGLAFVLRGAALARGGSLVFVQPLLLSGLLFALVLESLLERRRLARTDAWACLALVAGLSVFVLAASPQSGRTTPPPTAWLSLATVVGLLAVGSIFLSFRRPRVIQPTQADKRAQARADDAARAAWLALAAGLLLASTAALMKQAGSELADHGIRALTSWSPYGLAIVGGLAVLVTQSAFQAGPLRASLPVLSMVEPLASVVIGVWVFHEGIATSAPAVTGEAIGLTLLVVGVVILTKTLAEHQRDARPERGPVPGAPPAQVGASV